MLELTESYEIEKITVQALEAYVEALEKDYSTVLQEGDKAMQELRKENHELHTKAYHMKKNAALEIGNLKRNLEHI